ncbi:carbohydrate ABC transporter permease [Clostridium oryzae]|uniref:L-arabinose transport system permease protein AraQ n=1 Tax=Clostridium oryzae TaxID=1450648 RepID=A0A1V4IQ57_9CLOT|nr:carbohydrate ABC transporter permease [Clostridium oryzae]OPJ61950.1 L-arabinose transport system permease protein AraQ [Clostridium oryzae]
MNNKTKIKKSSDKVAFNIISYAALIFVALVCFLPFLMVVSGSFTSEQYIEKHGFGLLPKDFSTVAYSMALKDPIAILRAYGVTISVTVIGTVIGLFITAMTAYVLQRKDFEWRNKFAFYFFFTTLFSGGLVPWYILMVKYLHMKNNYLALVIPPMLSVFNMLVMKSFMSSIPGAISESAKIDGAGDFTIFVKLILPLAKPALATVGLFTALGYWNDWYNSMLFMQNEKLYSLQYFLYKIVNNIEAYKQIVSQHASVDVNIELPSESFKMALTVIVTGPIILLYPFVQRYFVQGITIGAVKG